MNINDNSMRGLGRTRVGTLWTVLLLCFPSCHGEEPAQSKAIPPFHSSLDNATLLSELAEEDYQTLCRSYTQYPLSAFSEDEYRNVACSTAPMLAGADEDTCSAERDSCINSWPTDPCAGAVPPVGCQATIGQLESCLSVQLAGTYAHRQKITCSSAGESAAMQAVGEVLYASECREVLLTCPGLALGNVSVDQPATPNPTSGSGGTGGEVAIDPGKRAEVGGNGPRSFGGAGGMNSGGTDSGGTDSGGTDSGGTDSGGTDSGGTDSGGTDSGGTDSGGTDSGGADGSTPAP